MKPTIHQKVQCRLRELAEPSLRAFASTIIPGAVNILGVRTPKLRDLAREICRDDWRAWLSLATEESHEETVLQAMVISQARMELEERLELVRSFIPKITTWGTCDVFCCGLKDAGKHPERFWDFIQPYLHDSREFHIRFGVVMMLAHFVTEPYLERILSLLDGIRHEGYYVKMAVAWAISACFIKFPDRTLPYLKENHLDNETFNKALQKIIDSFRVDPETKNVIRSLRRKAPPQKR
jgi:3-methyladenine DNA glycosylase AlkD